MIGLPHPVASLWNWSCNLKWKRMGLILDNHHYDNSLARSLLLYVSSTWWALTVADVSRFGIVTALHFSMSCIVDDLSLVEALEGCFWLFCLPCDSLSLADGLAGRLSLTSVILLNCASQWSRSSSDFARMYNFLKSRSPSE